MINNGEISQQKIWKGQITTNKQNKYPINKNKHTQLLDEKINRFV